MKKFVASVIICLCIIFGNADAGTTKMQWLDMSRNEQISILKGMSIEYRWNYLYRKYNECYKNGKGPVICRDRLYKLNQVFQKLFDKIDYDDMLESVTKGIDHFAPKYMDEIDEYLHTKLLSYLNEIQSEEKLINPFE